MTNRFAPGRDFHRIPDADPRTERAGRIKALRDNLGVGMKYDKAGRLVPDIDYILAQLTGKTSGSAASSSGGTVSPKSLAQTYVSSGGSASDPVVQSPTGGSLGGVKNIRTVTADTLLKKTDSVLWFDATSASGTVTLPSAALNQGRSYFVKKVDSSGNTVTLVDAAGYNVEFASSLAISTQGDSVEVIAGKIGTTPQWGII